MYTNTRVFIKSLSDEEIKRKFSIYKFVGYHRLFVELDFYNYNFMVQRLNHVKELSKLEIYGRISLTPSSIRELKTQLKKINNNCTYVVSVESDDLEILTFSAKDSRIDILSFPHLKYIKIITPGIFSLLKQSKKFLEISLIDAFEVKHLNRSRIFREFYKIINLARNKYDILLYGGAESDNQFIRGPREIYSILNSIFDIPLKFCKLIIKDNPESLMETVENFNDPNYIENGIKIVNRIEKK